MDHLIVSNIVDLTFLLVIVVVCVLNGLHIYTNNHAYTHMLTHDLLSTPY